MDVRLAEVIQSYQQNKSKYHFFDMNCWSPFTDQNQLHSIMGIESIVSELAKHHIRDALVTNAECIEYHPASGNEHLLLQIKEYNTMYGAIVWAPEIAQTKISVVDYVERMIASRVAIVRMFPKRLNYSLKKWQVGDILKVMESKRLPLLLWHIETNWDTIHEICAEYPLMPVIVEGNDQKLLYHNRYFIPLLEQHENLYIETHNLIQHGGIEYIVNERGIDRLLFGTYFPYNDPNSAMMMITDAEISEDKKLNIAGGHIRNLLRRIIHD